MTVPSAESTSLGLRYSVTAASTTAAPKPTVIHTGAGAATRKNRVDLALITAAPGRSVHPRRGGGRRARRPRRRPESAGRAREAACGERGGPRDRTGPAAIRRAARGPETRSPFRIPGPTDL